MRAENLEYYIKTEIMPREWFEIRGEIKRCDSIFQSGSRTMIFPYLGGVSTADWFGLVRLALEEVARQKELEQKK